MLRYLDDVLVLPGQRRVVVIQRTGHLGARRPDARSHGDGNPQQVMHRTT